VHDFAALLEHRLLVLADRNSRSVECGDVRRLTDRIAEKTDRNAGFKVAHLDLCLNGRVALYTGHGDKVHIVERQLGQLRHHGLDEDIRLFRVNADRKIVQRDLHNVLAHALRVLGVVGQRLRVRNHDVNFVIFSGILQLHALGQ